VVTTKYGRDLDDESLGLYFKKIKNDIFKLLPLREEGAEWDKHLRTILIELNGFDRLTEEFKLISILSKLESLYEIKEFVYYRKTIFEILSLFDGLR